MKQSVHIPHGGRKPFRACLNRHKLLILLSKNILKISNFEKSAKTSKKT